MNRLDVHLTAGAARTYPIHIGRGLLDQAGRLVRDVHPGGQVLLVSDSTVAPLYADRTARAFAQAGYRVQLHTFPAGEASKRLDTVTEIYTHLAQAGFGRGDLLAALGGGVTGDMTGFAAATWMRGVPFVQLPTTLLAQVDSSVGGKTGVDIPAGKNLVGAFWQPACVVADPDVLHTLPPAVFADGMAEVIKAACIRDAALFDALEDGSALRDTAWEETLARCIAIKRDVVERDETEAGERKLLNFGHTLGHALERYYRYEGLTHGCAVAVGMMLLTEAGERQGLTAPGTAARLARLLTRFDLPVSDPAPLAAILPGVASDKKRAGADIDLILLRRIGDGLVRRTPLGALARFVGVPVSGEEAHPCR